jgi:hypothetical protein
MTATTNARDVLGEATLGELEATLRASWYDRPIRPTTRPVPSGTPPTTDGPR